MVEKNAIVDNYSKEELQEIVGSCISYAELKRKLGYSPKGKNSETIKNRLDKFGISTAHFTHIARKKVERRPDNVFVQNSTASQGTLRRWFKRISENEYVCSVCGLHPVWNDKPLVLRLDHINGDHTDNRLQNLRWVCPNCDSQSSTFAGRNIKNKNRCDSTKKRNKYSVNNMCIDCGKPIQSNAIRCQECYFKTLKSTIMPEKAELENAIIECDGNFVKVSKMFGVSDNAVRRWCKKYEMPTHSKEYKTKKMFN